MKRIVSAAAALVVLLSLAGCARQQPETDMMPAEIAAAILESQAELPELRQAVLGDADFAAWLSDYDGVRAECLEGGAICCADGVEASEVAVLVLKEARDAEAVERALAGYIQRRAAAFEGYAPQQAALAGRGVAVTSGRHVALLICPDPQAAKRAFLACFEGRAGRRGGESAAPAEQDLAEDAQAPADGGYDSAAVLQAWRTGDDSALDEFNRSVLDAAREVIERETVGCESDYERELAIHDWITGWSRFDMSAFSRAPGSGASNSDNPYGVLIDRTGNCWGYASTFQLFMDMLDIECITVRGTPNASGVEHCWNMVRLDGDWYCVDAAWDDPIGGSPGHAYFNVTSAELRAGGIHRWNEAAVPEAAGTAYAYGGR